MATMDGATVEIHESVGDENIYIFGLTSDEVQTYYNNRNYNSRNIYDGNPRVKRVLNMLVDGSIPGIFNEGQDIFDSLVKFNDEYFLLKDFDGYIEAQAQADRDFTNRKKWNKMALLNIANSARFSADYTIQRYAEEIWQIKPRQEHKKIMTTLVEETK